MVGSYLAGALLLIGALGVVLLPSLRAAGAAFVAFLLLVAALAWLLDAPVLAAVQLVVAVAAAAGFWLLPWLRLSPTPPQRGGNESARPSSAPPQGGGDKRAFSGQLIPGAIAAAAVLSGVAFAVFGGTWGLFEPAGGASWREYLVGFAVAILVLLVGALGLLTLTPGQARHARPAEAGAGGRRPGRR